MAEPVPDEIRRQLSLWNKIAAFDCAAYMVLGPIGIVCRFIVGTSILVAGLGCTIAKDAHAEGAGVQDSVMLSGRSSTTPASQIELEAQTGHTAAIKNLRFIDVSTGDERNQTGTGKVRLVSTSNDETTKIWDVGRGQAIFTFGDARSSGTFPPLVDAATEHEVFASAVGNVVKLYSAGSAKLEAQPITADDHVISIAINSEASQLAIATKSAVEVWSIKPQKRLLLERSFLTEKVFFSRDGKTLGGLRRTSDGLHSAVESWSLSEGRLSSLYRTTRPLVHAFRVVENTILLFENHTCGVNVPCGSVTTLRFPDLTETTSARAPMPAAGAVFNEDGTLLMIGQAHGDIIEWDVRSTTAVRRLRAKYSYIGSLALSSDGKLLAAGDLIGNIFLWNLEGAIDEESAPRTLASPTEKGFRIAVSPDGKWFASAGFSTINPDDPDRSRFASSVRIWNTTRLDGPMRLEGSIITSFSSDSRVMAFSGPRNLTFFEPAEDHLTPTALPAAARAMALSPDGGMLVAAYRDKLLSTTRMKPTENTEWTGPEDWVDMAFDPSGKVLAVIGARSAWIWNVVEGKGRQIWHSDDAALQLFSVRFDLTGNRLVWAGTDGVIYIWDVTLNRMLDAVPKRGGAIIALAVNDRYIATGRGDGSVSLWDLNAGGNSKGNRFLKEFVGHRWIIQSLSFGPGPTLMSGSWDGTIRIWQLDGEPIATLSTLTGTSDWLAATPKGLFDGSAFAMSRISWLNGKNQALLPLESLYNDFFYPGLLPELFVGGRPTPKYDLATAMRIPGLRTLCAEGIAVVDRHNSKRPRLCIAGSLGQTASDVASELGFSQDPRSQLCTYFKDLVDDLAELAPTCIRQTQNGSSSEPHHKSNVMGSVLHVLTVAVSNYPKHLVYRNGYNYPPVPVLTKMADDFESAFDSEKISVAKKSQKPSTGYREVRIWDHLRDDGATRKAILDRLSEMAKGVGPDDVVVLYFAGHGRVFPDEEMFYYISYSPGPKPGQLVAQVDEQDVSLSAAMMADAIRGLPARRVFLVIDACQSGGALESLTKIGMVKVEAEERRAKYASGGERGSNIIAPGMHIVVASMSVEQALAVGDKEGNRSLLTDAILRAMQSHILADSDGQIWASGILKELNDKRLAGSAGDSQTVLSSSAGSDFPIALPIGSK